MDKRNVLSFGCELEFIVAYVEADEADPDADIEGLAPILRVPRTQDSINGPDHAQDYIFEHVTNTLREAGLTVQKDCNWPPPSDIDADRARTMFGISVKQDNTVIEWNGYDVWNGYRLQGLELNTSASWTSPVAFQELELITQVLLHNYRVRVNRNCGLHFHVGNGPKPLNTQTVKRVAALLWCLDPIACHVHPPQRRRTAYTLPIRENTAFACADEMSPALCNDTFFRERKIGKPKLSASARMAPARLARTRRFPFSHLATSRADPDTHAELEQAYPDGFDGQGLTGIGMKVVDSALDGVWRLLSCSTTVELTDLMRITYGRPFKPNYSFTGYSADQNVDVQDEWSCQIESDRKLTIEFREAVGSLDAEWISAWGRICAGIVLFAQNASTADFFGMVMRLAQAQGDFGGPGPALYDFIDFLDDIGCFAEAEVLEAKLQDKKMFWYPCRKLTFTDEDMSPQSGPTSPAADGQEFWTPPLTPPQGSSKQSSWSPPTSRQTSPWPWGGKPPNPARKESEKEEDAWASGKEDSIDDAVRTESGAPEHESTTERDDKGPTATGSDRLHSTVAPKTGSAGCGPADTTTADDEGSIADERKESSAANEEHATVPTPEGDSTESTKISCPDPEIDTVNQGTEGTLDGRLAAEQEAARVAASEKYAREAYATRFPNGHETIDVSAAGLLCGPRALIQSIVGQEPELLYPPPTVEGLQELLDAADIPYVDDSGELTSEKNRDNYNVDQLAVMLQAWGRELHPDLVLRLGVVRPHKAPFLCPVTESDRQLIVWVWNDDAQDEELGIYGHYQGLRPAAPPAVGQVPPAQATVQFAGIDLVAPGEEEEEEL